MKPTASRNGGTISGPRTRKLARFRDYFPGVPVIALTATAIPEVRKDICRQLGLVHVQEFVGSFNRENLTYKVTEKKNPLILITDILSRHKNEPGIIYCMSRKTTVELTGEGSARRDLRHVPITQAFPRR